MGAPAGLAAQPPRLVVAVLGWLRKRWLSAGALGAIAGFAAVPATLAGRKEGRMMVARDEPTPQEWRQILLDEYQEVCKSHAAITDFRAKLLALLPVASGAGVGLLLTQADGKDGIPASLLVALGTFGALVTVGLFLYEFHQMDDCQQLRNHGVWIEKELGIVAGISAPSGASSACPTCGRRGTARGIRISESANGKGRKPASKRPVS